MDERFFRTAMLVGEQGVAKLQNSSVAIFGLGGVGGQLVESLARAGVGRFLLVDFDTISLSNFNRQILALSSTLGMKKTAAAKQRILDINPCALVTELNQFVDAASLKQLDLSGYDFVADCVDAFDSKIAIISAAKAQNRQIISCMGAGNRLFADFLVCDIKKTHGCPLARKVRMRLKDLKINDVLAVFSPSNPDGAQSENTAASPSATNCDTASAAKQNSGHAAEQIKGAEEQKNSQTMAINIGEKQIIIKTEKCYHDRKPLGSISFIPPAAALCMAGEIIRRLLN